MSKSHIKSYYLIFVSSVFLLLSFILLLCIRVIVTDSCGICSQKTFLKGKNILWLGTSIPAGVADNNYPKMVGEILGANVINNSLGSSTMRSGFLSSTHGDPLGIRNMDWECSTLALMQTVLEKEKIISEWNDKWGNPNNSYKLDKAPTSLSEMQKERIIESSYERRLLPYIDGTHSFPDLIVIDHGHNDYYGQDDIKILPEDPYDRKFFLGASNLMIKMILERKPTARIVLVGRYEDDTRRGLTDAQEILANYWNIPILKLWEVSGFSNNIININGEKKAMKKWYMPDSLHPSSDHSGETNKRLARIIASWLDYVY